MEYKAFIQRAGRTVVVASFLGLGLGANLAMAQAEPTLNQVYATAQTGKLDEAQVMMQQVLVAHPNSAKAHFVQGELYARRGDMSRAREALAIAEKLAPGLPFAKPEAVQALRTQLSAKSAPATRPATTQMAAPVAAVAAPASQSSSWGLPLLLAGGVLVAGYFIFRRKTSAALVPQQPTYANQGGLNGPQTFGMANGAGGVGMQPGYGQGGYGQPAGSGMGGRIMGGVATGLAVGAGVMAAQAIGRNLMGDHNTPSNASDSGGGNNYQPIESNTNMGGQDFGINDTSSWDDGGSSDVGGGGDWDN
jgi:hypothetical protein